jgi:hypothetical protein
MILQLLPATASRPLYIAVVDDSTETRLKKRCMKEYADRAVGARSTYTPLVLSGNLQHQPMLIPAQATAKRDSLLI